MEITPAEEDRVTTEEIETELPLHGDVLELILSRVPLLHLLPALSVSRCWSRAVRSSLLHLNPPKPWLLRQPRSSSPRALPPAAAAYDPSSRTWLRLLLLDRSAGILRSSGNLLYSVSTSKLSFSSDPLHLSWRHLEGPLVWRADPIVALVGRRLVVAGGACDFEDDPMAVEAYDLDEEMWSSSDAMPSALRDCPASTWLSVAAVGDAMCVMEKATGALHVYDARDATWLNGPVDLGIAREARWWAIGSTRGGLLVAGAGGSAKGVKLWEVEAGTWRVSGEAVEMPGEMAGRFGGGGRAVGLCCSMGGGFAYVYGGEGGEVAWCEASGKGVWRWGWVEGGGGGGDGERAEALLTCADVGLEELAGAATGHHLMITELAEGF